MLKVTTSEVARAVFAKDACGAQIETCEEIVDLTLRQVLGVNAAMGRESVEVDLGNGYSLSVKAIKNDQRRPAGVRG